MFVKCLDYDLYPGNFDISKLTLLLLIVVGDVKQIQIKRCYLYYYSPGVSTVLLIEVWTL